MPKLPIDYSKTIMYKLVCNDLNVKECYVGHTTDMTKRKNKHKSSCNNEKGKEFNEKKYVFIRENGGWENWVMVMIEEYNCKNKQEATKRERELYEELQSTLNTFRPYVNEVEIKEYTKEYYETNKETYKEKQKENYKNNKEIFSKRHKKYRENNKEYFKEYKKEYYETNKVKITEKKKEKGCCEYCNKEMRIDCIKRHHKTCPNLNSIISSE
jgi:hypothetical protein